MVDDRRSPGDGKDDPLHNDQNAQIGEQEGEEYHRRYKLEPDPDVVFEVSGNKKYQYKEITKK